MIGIFKIIKYQLYLLQLENYELGRYFKLLFKKGFWPKGEQRKSLVWTAKAKTLMLMAVGLHLLIVVTLIFWSLILAIVVGFVLLTIYSLLFTLALLLLWPLDFLLKQIVITRAKSKILNLKSQIKIIGIAGSYGKTTMKEVLKQILDIRYKILATPESVNTPVGISRWILKNVDASTEILIVEMGEHYKGDIEDICNIVKPDISVVTGINESHLERMKNMDTVISTIFEIVSRTKPGGMVMLNGDDEKVLKHYKEFVWPDHRVAEYKVSSIMYKVFDPDALCWKIKLDEHTEASVNLLGEYALGDVDAAVKIAKSLGMSNEEIIAGIKNIKPVEHRLQPIKSAGNILVVDDAYNGNPAGVKEAIKVLSRFTNRRKVFITPGLVEMGALTENVHRQIGKELAGVADVVVLIKNSVTPDIELGIRNYELGKKPQVIWFETAQQAHSSLSTILKPGDVVVFQNDWGDQYV
jgi:UDP-N-acetylmuramoyl-tripeptide--D-alanyl-D-alanine ligase